LKKASPKRSSAVSPARVAAFEILLRVERESSYASDLLHSGNYKHLSTSDHALATELVFGVLRWRSLLDSQITQASTQMLAKLDLEVIVALRIGLYQLHWLNRVPAHAAVHQSVELVRHARKDSAAPFVNAVLRKLQKVATPRNAVAPGEGSTEHIARAFAHPQWLIERWVQAYGFETGRRVCRYNQTVPATAIRLRRAAAEETIQAEGIKLRPGRLLASARVVESRNITKSRAFADGDCVVQDECSQLVAALARGGRRVLDCCAAPGGKTLAMADHDPQARIIAVDLHPHRARLLRRLVLTDHVSNALPPNISVVAADASQLPLCGNFDRVLADVPCSGTGTLARNPEIKWHLKPDDLIDLQQRQVAILRSAMMQLSPRGRVIYSTCSLEKEENEDVIEQVLAEVKTFCILDCRVELDLLRRSGKLTWHDPASLTRGPYLRTLPGVHPCDGFFAAILERI
jgi:16S rRNA (cytosine967-C5)-methyltransferase